MASLSKLHANEDIWGGTALEDKLEVVEVSKVSLTSLYHSDFFSGDRRGAELPGKFSKRELLIPIWISDAVAINRRFWGVSCILKIEGASARAEYGTSKR